jgi:ATP synthase protein I
MSMRDQEHMWKLASRYSAVGIEMAVAITVPMLVGVWADKRWGTAPWLLLAGLVIGFGAAAQAVWRVVKLARRDDRRGPRGP